MSKFNLTMTFQTASKNKVNIVVEDVQPTLLPAKVKTLMDTIVAENIFETKYGDITGKLEAKIVESNVEKITF